MELSLKTKPVLRQVLPHDPFYESCKKRFRGFQDKKTEILEGIFADDLNMLNVRRDLVKKLDGEAKVNDDGFLEYPFILRDHVRRLLFIPGYPMIPKGQPHPFSRPKERFFKKKGHKQLFDDLLDLMFMNFKPCNIRINNVSTSGLPDWSKKAEDKDAIFRRIADNTDLVSKHISNFDLNKLVDMGIVIGAHASERVQSTDKISRKGKDYIPKDRFVYSGGNEVLSKRTIDNLPGFFRPRTRDIKALSGSVNYWIQQIASGFRSYYSKTYSFTWEHKGKDDILSKINRYRKVVGYDISQFDSSISKQMMFYMFDRLPIEDWIKRMCKLSLSAPIYFADDTPSKNPDIWAYGNVNDVSTYINDFGLPSGFAFTSDIGKLFGVWQTLVTLYDLDIIPKKDSYRKYLDDLLRGNLELGILNMGDDTVLLFNGDSHPNKVTAYLAENRNPYFNVGIETPISFLGFLICITPRGYIDVYPDVMGLITNFLSPERGIRDAFRKYWKLGWHERKHHFSMSPSYGEVYEIFDSSFIKYYGSTLDHLVGPPSEVPAYNGSNIWDRVFLSNPSSIFYKVDPNSVSKDFINQFFLNIPKDYVKENVSQFIKCRIMED